ncbi:hypothetical protein ACOMHN_057843 [Nucella lapillus]
MSAVVNFLQGDKDSGGQGGREEGVGRKWSFPTPTKTNGKEAEVRRGRGRSSIDGCLSVLAALNVTEMMEESDSSDSDSESEPEMENEKEERKPRKKKRKSRKRRERDPSGSSVLENRAQGALGHVCARASQRDVCPARTASNATDTSLRPFCPPPPPPTLPLRTVLVGRDAPLPDTHLHPGVSMTSQFVKLVKADGKSLFIPVRHVRKGRPAEVRGGGESRQFFVPESFDSCVTYLPPVQSRLSLAGLSTQGGEEDEGNASGMEDTEL